MQLSDLLFGLSFTTFFLFGFFLGRGTVDKKVEQIREIVHEFKEARKPKVKVGAIDILSADEIAKQDEERNKSLFRKMFGEK